MTSTRRHRLPPALLTLLSALGLPCFAKASACLLFLSAFSFQLSAFSSTVRINEVMASNGSTLADEDGDFEDWIELHNYGGDPVDLSGWGLSDDYDNPFRWTFPDGTTIGAGEYLLVWASGKDRREDVPYMSVGEDFSFDPPWEEIPLSTPLNSTIENRQYASFDPDGKTGFTAAYDPDNATNRAGWSIPPLPPGRTIRVEAMIDTGGTNTFVSVAFGGGFGSFAPSRVSINSSVLAPFVLEITNQTADGLEHLVFVSSPVSGSSLVVRDLRVYLAPEAHLFPHANYSISSAGEEVILTLPDGTRVDELEPTSIPRDVSVGRVEGEGDAWFYYDQPTPAATNDTTPYLGILDPPLLSHGGGFYEQSFDLALTHPDPDVTIVYTIDGSEPDINNLDGKTYHYKNQYPEDPGQPFGPFLEGRFESKLYESPIYIFDRSLSPNNLAWKSSTYDWEPNYFPEGPIRKGTPVRASAFRSGFLPSRIITETYFVFSDGNPYNIPVISINVQEDYLFDYYEGVYTAGIGFDTWREENPETPTSPRPRSGNYYRSGREAERLGNFEFFEPSVDASAINQIAGVRVHGGGSRNNPLKSLRLYSRDYGGETAFRHRIFEQKVPFAVNEESTRFRRLLLRGSRGYVNDLVSHKIMQPVYEGVHRARPAIHFINGEYFGITSIRDRFDEFHLAEQFNLDSDNLLIIRGMRGRGNLNNVDTGGEETLELYRDLYDFALDNDLSNEDAFLQMEAMLDFRSYADYFIMSVFLTSWDGFGGGHHALWRVREISDHPYADGRWRCFTWDYDSVANPLDRNLLASALAEDGGEFNPNKFAILRGLMQNMEFRDYFINRFADHLNSTFKTERIQSIIENEVGFVDAFVEEHQDRWNGSPVHQSEIRRFVEYSEKRPNIQRGHLRDQFDLEGDFTITLVNPHHANGGLRINTIEINSSTLGLSDPSQPYPWTGIYFQNVPIEVEGLPEPGHRFVGWLVSATDGVAPQGGEPAYYSMEAVISLDLSEDTTVEAVFEPIPLAEQPVALHIWDFEDAEALLAPVSLVEGGALVIEPGPHPDWGAIPNTGGDFATQHLRVNNPLGTALTFTLPTTGYDTIALDFLTRRSGQGAEQMFVEYTTDGTTWTPALDDPHFLTIFNAPPQAHGFDFSEVPGVADNADFGVRFTFAQGEGGEAGNNRFDDIVLTGVALPETKLPPVVNENAVPNLVSLTAGGAAAVIDLEEWFTDPDGDSMTFSVEVSNTSVLGAGVDGGELTLLGIGTGDAVITVTADDGGNPPVAAETRVLIYPTPFVLGGGNFLFDQWAADSPAGSFPDHMIFLQSEVSDPDLEADLLHAYSIAGDAHADDDADCPYAAERRTRINGLGEDGISFINTGRGRDLGAALVALDTTGVTDIGVSFTAQTLLPNDRVYGLRLQARIGQEGPWEDVFHGEEAVEYVRAEIPDEPLVIGPVSLPEALENQPLVQLQWRYHHIEGDSGQRAMLRLDDIVVTSSASPVTPETLVIEGLPAHPGEGPLPPLTVRVVDANGILAGSFIGPVTLTAESGGLTGTTTVEAVDGVAFFDDLALSGAGSVVLTASADGIPTAGEALTRVLRLVEVLLPQYVQGEQDANNDNFNRIPFAYRVRVEGLQPGAIYRYGNRFVLDAQDTEPDDNGAGNFILIPSDGGPFVRSTSAPRFRAGDLNSRHAELTADGAGVWEGWLISEPSGNARFTPGNQVRPLLMLNDGAGGEDPAWFLRAASTVEVIALGVGPGEATAVYGEAAAGVAFVALYADETPEGRPLAASPVEATGAETDDRYAEFYHEAVAGNPGLWGSLIPNLLPEGLRAVVSLAADGTESALASYPDGSGGTVNASGGTTAVWVPETGEFRYLPPGDGRWNEPNHWTRDLYPDGGNMAAIIGAPLGGNRNIELPEGALATVGEVGFTNGDWRNRLRGAGTFTFDGGVESARILVTDAGEGFAEFDFDTPVILATDLILETAEVEADPVEPEYGSLRLRGEWTGPGGLVKRGPGMASLTGGGKNFTGPLEIEEGVLRLSEPAAPGAVSSVTVHPGGQMRLVSEGLDRNYFFGAPISLAGSGRDPDDVPLGEQYGILGALRFDPPGNDNAARVMADVILEGVPGAPVSLHVDGTRNLLDLAGLLGGSATLSKTGGGTLRLSGDGTAPTPLAVSNGQLRVDGDFSTSSVSLGGEGRLAGTGQVGEISGAGTIEVAAGEIFSALRIGGLSYVFETSASPSSTGGLLRLRDAEPFAGVLNPANRINLLLNSEEALAEEHTVGFFIDAGTDPVAFAAGADWHVYLVDEEGAHEWNGQTYRHLADVPTLRLSSENLTVTVGGGAVSGRVLTVGFGDAPSLTYQTWAEENFSGAELADPEVSGAAATPAGDGVANLIKYALGLAPLEPVTAERLVSGLTDDGRLFLRFYRDPAKTDIVYLVEASGDLVDWSNLIFDSSDEPFTPNTHGEWHEVRVEIEGELRRFLRLRVEEQD